MKGVKIAIIIPEYNEVNRAVETVRKVLRSNGNQVIIIDDGSTDNSYDLLKNEFRKNKRVVLRRHILNLGKGATMKTGVELAWKMGFGAVIFLDADGQHNPKYIKLFEKKLEKFPVVFGYRILDKKMPTVRRWGNIFAANLVKVVFNVKKRDLLSGYLGFRKEIYDLIKWNSSRYGIETEMATKIGKNKVPFTEVKIDTIYIDKYKGVSLLDGIKILMQIPFWYFEK